MTCAVTCAVLCCSQAQHELGDMDDPINAWVAGKRAELFQYDMAGTVPAQSGGWGVGWGGAWGGVGGDRRWMGAKLVGHVVKGQVGGAAEPQ